MTARQQAVAFTGTNLIVPESTVPGTRAWAETVVDNARAYASFTEKDVRPLVERYLALCEHGVWETWFADEPKTLERFCREALGYERQFLETMSTGVAVLDGQAATPASVTPGQAAAIRSAHHALEARGRGKGGPHSTTDACRIIRDLLDVLAGLTGITSASETLPFAEVPAEAAAVATTGVPTVDSSTATPVQVPL